MGANITSSLDEQSISNDVRSFVNVVKIVECVCGFILRGPYFNDGLFLEGN